MLRQFADKYNGKLVTNHSEHVTHVVTGARLASGGIVQFRTIKYLHALLDGKWILCFDWVERSLDSGALCNELKYEVMGHSSGIGTPARALHLLHAMLDWVLRIVLTNAKNEEETDALHKSIDSICTQAWECWHTTVSFYMGMVRHRAWMTRLCLLASTLWHRLFQL